MPVWSAFDIGSNTVRLLIADVRKNEVKFIRRENIITRLAGGYTDAEGLSHDAIMRTLLALKEFCNISRQHRVSRLEAVGTEILRRARNGKEFCDLARKETGLDIRVISPDMEARLMLAGVLNVLGGEPDHCIILDIGGASTEMILLNGKTVLDVTSIPIGAVNQTEKFLLSDPPSLEEIRALRESVRDKLSEAIKYDVHDLDSAEQDSKGVALLGTAGTITSLGAIAQGMKIYDIDKINNYVLLKTKVEELLELFIGIKKEQRKTIPVLSPGRADIIVGGTVLLSEIMNFLGANEIRISDSGLLEGIILDALDRNHEISGI